MSNIPKRGRPTVDRSSSGPSPVVAVRVAPADMARAEQRAAQTRESVQDMIRRGLRRELDDPPRP